VTLALRPMRPDEFEPFAEHGRVGYADQMVEFGGATRQAAEVKAERDYQMTLPQGLDTPGHWFFVAEDDGRRVGTVWFAERVMDGRMVAYLYEIEVEEAERGKGFGRAAMEAFEREASRRGLTRMELNVFGGNEVARSLYRSLGWQEASVHMTKQV
jgi:GNAT superfamily N-acetyltransferase